MRYIYVLKDPITNEIRYVGQTDNLKRRYNSHLSNSKNEITHKSRWIKKLIAVGKKPIIEIIENCENLEQSNVRERYYIDKFTIEGVKLTNSHVGDVSEFSIETKNKMSNARKGKTLEEIVGIEKSLILRKIASDKWKVNNPNKSDNPLVREKISNTLKEYFEDKTNHWAYGKKMDEESRNVSRDSHLNNPKNVGNRKPRTEEQKEKLRNKISGTKVRRSKIYQFDMNGRFIKEWQSLREIQRIEPTFSRSQISSCCNNNRNSYGGFIWKFKD